MTRGWSSFLLVGATGVAVSFLAALAYVASNSWFGSGDLVGFLWLSVPFGIVLSVAARLLRRDLSGWSRHAALLASVAAGLVLGVGWAFLARLALGLSIYAFSFPVLYLWSAGGTAGLALASRLLVGTSPGDQAPMSAVRRFAAYAVGLPVLAVFLITLLSFGRLAAGRALSKRAEPEIHLIPAGYMGDVYIIHNASEAAPPEYEEGRRVYRIGSDGVHKTQLDRNNLLRMAGDRLFFYVGQDGTRVPITEYWPTTIPDTPENRADTSTVGIYFIQLGTTTRYNPTCETTYTMYSVGTKAHLLKVRTREPQPHILPCTVAPKAGQ